MATGILRIFCLFLLLLLKQSIEATSTEWLKREGVSIIPLVSSISVQCECVQAYCGFI